MSNMADSMNGVAGHLANNDAYAKSQQATLDAIEWLSKGARHIEELGRPWVLAATENPPDAEAVLWRIESALGVRYEVHTFDDTPGRRSWPGFGTHWMRIPALREQEEENE